MFLNAINVQGILVGGAVIGTLVLLVSAGIAALSKDQKSTSRKGK